jgi:hypothetical protein
MAGLDPAIHSGTVVVVRDATGMDARIKSGHDDVERSEHPFDPSLGHRVAHG